MAIPGYDEHQFGDKLNEVLSPSHPINSIENLFGREEELEKIRQALLMSGKHIFVYGDRGVGKSSLGATAAYQYQSSDRLPIIVGGSVDDTFRTVIANIANQALARNRLESVKATSSLSLEWRGIKWSEGQEISTKDIASQIESVSDAADLLNQVAERIGGKAIVVIDEFDAIPSDAERNKFASLLKQLGDRQINLKFIFTAVGSALDQLLGAHQSAYRQLESVLLGRLGWDGRREIVSKAVHSFGIEIDDEVNWRIATVSDGYPFYVHEITAKTLWAAFSTDEDVETITFAHYAEGLRAAIQGITPELKRPYEKAVLHRDREYEDIVWSTADGEDLFRSLAVIYQSYRMVTEQRQDRTVLDSKKFADCLRKLKTPAFGEVIEQVPRRIGWYTYKEKMLRGFVRMQAEANEVNLRGDLNIAKQHMHVPFNARVGYRGSSVPQGVNINRRFGKDNK